MKRGREADRKIIPVIGGSDVHVGRGLLDEIPAEMLAHKKVKASRFVIVSDENVMALYGKRLVDAFMATGKFKMSESKKFSEDSVIPPSSKSSEDVPDDAGDTKTLLTYEVPHGEGSKSRSVKDAIEDFMISHRCNRDTIMIALGGGVVGDLVGYVAATYMRGVPYFQIPTSATGMIDSSVGGKTAINVPGGKNLIGAFHQPLRVYMDMDLLVTLGRRELVEGLAEALKMGCIRYPSLFDMMEKEYEKVMALDEVLITQVIFDAVAQKAEVVRLDEKEAGLRGTLNWGHTIGHAIEALKSPAMMHGECVAVGCVAEAELSFRMGNASLSQEKIARITKCFESYGLPVHVPKGLEIDKLMQKMSLDKKNLGNSIRCTIVTDIGVSITDPQPVDKEMVKAVMRESAVAGGAKPEWVPLKGNCAVATSGGQMAA